MSPDTEHRRSRVLVYAAGLWLAGASVLGAQPVFVVYEPLKHTFSSARSHDAIEIFLSSAKPVADPQLAIVQLKGPNGDLLASSALRVESAPKSPLSSAGDRFSLRVGDDSAFRIPGDYVAALRFTGRVDDAPASQLASLILTQPKPQIDFSRHQNSTVRVWRTFPGMSATGAVQLSIEEVTNRAAVANLVVQREELFRKGTTDRAPGQVELAKDTNGADGTGVTLPAGRQRDLSLTFSGLSPGTSTTALAFSSPSLDARQRLAFQVEVSDWWLAPLVVIALGVLVGSWVRYLADVRRPIDQARYRQQLLLVEIGRWRDRARDPRHIQELDLLEEQLRAVDLRLQLRDTVAATTALDKVDAALIAFRTAWEQRLKTVREALSRAEAQALQLQERVTTAANPIPADVQTLEAALAELRQAAAHLARYDMTAAEVSTTAAAATLATLEGSYPQSRRRGLAPAGRPASSAGVTLMVRDAPDDLVAGREVTFAVEVDEALAADGFLWEFGDGRTERTTGRQVRHRYEIAGAYRVRVTARQGEQALAAAALTIEVTPRPIERLAADAALSWRRTNHWLTAASFLVAVITGMSLLYVGRSFGAPQHYLEAFLWGIGIDSAVKNIADVTRKF